MRQLLPLIILVGVSSVLQAQEQNDSLKPRIIRQWTLSPDYSEEVALPMDTIFALSHQNRKADKFSPLNAYPGNYGLPLYQMNFFDRITNADRFLYRNYYPFMHLSSNPVFMNTQVPFTEMGYSHAGKRDRAEQTLFVRHSQNVNRYLNFGIVFDVVYSLGQYNYQRSDNKNFNYYTSYTGDKYKLYLSGGINNIISYENGGIVDKSQLSSYDTRDVQVNLGSMNVATTTLKNRNLLIVQRYSVNKIRSSGSDTLPERKKGGLRLYGTFSHIFEWDKTRKSYHDQYPMSGFYDTSMIYISKTVTLDSLSMGVIKNTIRFDFGTDGTGKVSLGGGFGIRNELFRYSQIIPSDASPPSDTAAWRKNNNALIGRLYNNIGKKFRWVANGELFLTGYRSGDFDLNGTITKEFEWKAGMARWDINGGMRSSSPSFWLNSFGSNHFKWQNDFQKEFRIDAGTVFNYPEGKLLARFNYAIIDNYLYFGPDALPSQRESGLSVLSAFVRKEFVAWKFHMANELLVQKSSNSDVADLPLVALRSAGFFEHNFHFNLTNGDLNTQIGLEVFYNTAYKGYAYMPATGVYYQQNTSNTGNYPYLNAFINLKVKRTRIFLTLDHFNAGLTGYNYFMVPDYPMSILMFKYGFAWTFYD
jgi:hypothetical protein